jgi:HD-GYP domain-containing protein (c-di-GMP phosphodiesterase class II)
MTSHRPYRAALPRESALAELRDGAGGRYDPETVAACLRVLERGFAFSSIQT